MFFEDINDGNNKGDDNDGGGVGSSSGGHGNKPTRYRGKGKEGITGKSFNNDSAAYDNEAAYDDDEHGDGAVYDNNATSGVVTGQTPAQLG